MLLPNPKDAVHKAWLYRTLEAIYGDALLARMLSFKGGTCAAMLGWLDRFSVDLDFDYVGRRAAMTGARVALEKIFARLGLEVKDASKKSLQYFLRYQVGRNERNTLKIDTTFPPPESNRYEAVRLAEINRVVRCQTKETMCANKLVAFIERFEAHEAIAGRDLYDIHHFFLQGFRYEEAVITERRRTPLPEFFKELVNFTEKKITQRLIDQDLNVLLSPEQFQRMRKILKRETLMFLRDELKRLPVS